MRLFQCKNMVLAGVLLACAQSATSATAAVAVISNRTAADIHFVITGQGRNNQAAETQYTAIAGDITVVALQRGEEARLTTDSAAYLIDADAAYFFGETPSGKVDLVRIGVAGMPSTEPTVVHSATSALLATPADAEAARTITVKIFVDDDEQANRAVWERRVRERLAACSEVLEHTCGIKIKVIGSGEWQLKSTITDFDSAVNEFSRTVDPGEARVAIGFTARYQTPSGRMHMGGTHGPLDRHILVREWSRYFSESERMEFLLHELGHYLGAVHSPESDAVMRPQLGDRQSRSKRFQIHFDPLNALAMNFVAEDIRSGHGRSVADLSPATMARLRAIYEEIDKALPSDPAAAQYLRILNVAAARRGVNIGSP